MANTFQTKSSSTISYHNDTIRHQGVPIVGWKQCRAAGALSLLLLNVKNI